PVSDIDTGVVISLKVLDPDGRLEKRTNSRSSRQVRLVPKADSFAVAYNPRPPGFIRSHRRRSRAGGDSSRLCRHPMFMAAAIPTALGETSLGACRKAAALVLSLLILGGPGSRASRNGRECPVRNHTSGRESIGDDEYEHSLPRK